MIGELYEHALAGGRGRRSSTPTEAASRFQWRAGCTRARATNRSWTGARARPSTSARAGPADRRAGRTRHPGPRHRHHSVRRRPGPLLGRAGHAARCVRPGTGHRPVDHGAARGREHRDRRRPRRPAPPGRQLLAPQGRAIVELEPPGSPLRREQVRLCHGGSASAWFPWAYVGADQITDVAYDAGLGEVEIWTVDGRWFASVGGYREVRRTDLHHAVTECLLGRPADDDSAWIDGTLRTMNGKLRVAGIGLALAVIATWCC